MPFSMIRLPNYPQRCVVATRGSSNRRNSALSIGWLWRSLSDATAEADVVLLYCSIPTGAAGASTQPQPSVELSPVDPILRRLSVGMAEPDDYFLVRDKLMERAPHA